MSEHEGMPKYEPEDEAAAEDVRESLQALDSQEQDYREEIEKKLSEGHFAQDLLDVMEAKGGPERMVDSKTIELLREKAEAENVDAEDASHEEAIKQAEMRAAGRLQQVYSLEDRGTSYGEILDKLGGFEEAERLLGSDYAKKLRELSELEAAYNQEQEDK